MSALTLGLIVLLVGAPIIDWIVTIILIRAALRAHVSALRERALLALGISVTTTLFLAAVLNTETGFPLWDDVTGHIIVRLVVAVLGVLPLYWLWLYATKRFRDRNY
jgi:hypothetical protein